MLRADRATWAGPDAEQAQESPPATKRDAHARLPPAAPARVPSAPKSKARCGRADTQPSSRTSAEAGTSAPLRAAPKETRRGVPPWVCRCRRFSSAVPLLLFRRGDVSGDLFSDHDNDAVRDGGGGFNHEKPVAAVIEQCDDILAVLLRKPVQF